MGLKQQKEEILGFIKGHTPYLEYNNRLFDIYSGNLAPYVLQVLQCTLSENYFKKIKDRVLPINVLTRIIDKLSKVYANDPIRTSDKYQDVVDFYTKCMDLNNVMITADEYANLFKGYSLEPFIDEGIPKLRALPFDRFLVMSDSKVDPTRPTIFIKFAGLRETGFHGTKKNVFYVYSKDEFYAFDEDGEEYPEALAENEGENPFEIIPFVYGNRSKERLIPIQDTDIMAMTKMIPVMLTDLSGAIMFQCFTVIYGIDVDAENLTMSPNAFWSLKSDKQSDKAPVVGTIKPEADVDKVLNFIKAVFSFWLETKGIKVGNIGSLDAGNFASGISKIIDEMDTFEIRKKSIQFFKREEQELWAKIRVMHNYWVTSGQLKGFGLIGDDFEISIEHDEPRPAENRTQQIDDASKEVKEKFLDRKSAIKRLYPDLSEEQIEERLVLIDEENKKQEPLLLDAPSDATEEVEGDGAAA